MKRRQLLRALSGCAAIVVAAQVAAQQRRTRLARIGVLGGGGSNFDASLAPFRRRLRELGYAEGESVSLVVRDARGKAERFGTLAGELVASRPDVLVAQGNVGVAALKEATGTIPIVMVSVTGPVSAGLVLNLRRPGGNITGLSNLSEGMSAKWLQLLKDTVPTLARVAVLRDPQSAGHVSLLEEIRKAGTALEIAVAAWNGRTAAEVERAFAAMRGDGIGGVIVLPHPLAVANLQQMVTLAARERLPTIYPFREFAEAGFLMSYGANVAELWYRAADYVDQILKGAKPADIPVEQPTKFELVINLKTAKTLGITIPQSVLVQASRVIE